MKAALLGGLVAGIPSSLPLLSICCFIWALGGGFLAVFMYMKNAPTAMTPGDGAKLGVRAGIVGAVVYIVVGGLMTLLGGALQFASMPKTGGEGAGVAALAAGLGIFAVFVGAAFVFGLAVAGGAIGAAVLGKNRPGGTGMPPPPPPTDFGTGGGYGGTGTGAGYGGTTPGGGYGGGTPSGSDFGGTSGGTTGAGGTGSTFGTGS